MAMQLDSSPAGIATLKKEMKQFIPISRGSRGTIGITVLAPGQSWEMMVGYVQKVMCDKLVCQYHC